MVASPAWSAASLRSIWPATLRRYGLRYFLRHRVQTLLAVIGIAVGVSVPVAVELAGNSARKALGESLQALFGDSTHQVLGNSGPVPASLYVALRRELGLRQLSPIVSAELRVGQERFILLGTDPLSDAGIHDGLWSKQQTTEMIGLFRESGQVLMSTQRARKMALEVGKEFVARHGGLELKLRLAGLFDSAGPATEHILLTDISVAGELLDAGERLDRIDLRLDTGEEERLRRWLPDAYRVVETGARTQAISGLSRAFYLNLQAMSLLALLVGAYLIYNTVSFSVLQRRADFGILRGLGGTPGVVMASVCFETLVLATLGSLAGMLLGIGLAYGLLTLVVRTMDDLYYTMPHVVLEVSPAILLQGLLIGPGIALLAVILPALDASRIPPIQFLQRSYFEVRAHRRISSLVVAAVALMLLAAVLGLISGSLFAGYLQLAMLVFGYGLLLPPLLWFVCRRLGQGVLSKRMMPRLALRETARHLNRSGPAVVALAVALSATIGTGVMIDSFRDSVSDWLANWLHGDVYVSIAGDGSDSSRIALPTDTLVRLQGLAEIADIEPRRVRRLPGDSGALQVLASDRDPSSLILLQQIKDARARYLNAEGVLISEPLSNRLSLELGARVQLPTGEGDRQLPVLGIFRDFASEHGVIMLPLGLYRQLWHDESISSLVVHASNGTSDDALLNAVRQALSDDVDRLRIVSRSAIRARSMQVFSRTFAVTDVLHLLIIIVAVIGVLVALMAMEIERRRDTAILRALGQAKEIALD